MLLEHGFPVYVATLGKMMSMVSVTAHFGNGKPFPWLVIVQLILRR